MGELQPNNLKKNFGNWILKPLCQSLLQLRLVWNRMKDGLANGWNCPHVQYLLNDLNLLDNIEVVSILLFKGFPLFGFLIFQFKNISTPLCLSRNKTKGYFGKNATLTSTKTLPKKQDYSLVIFQTTLSTYKLDSQNTNIGFFFLLKKKEKPHHTRVVRVMRLVYIIFILTI